MFKFVKQSWGGYKVFSGDQYLGLVEKFDGGWEAGDGTDHKTRKAAAGYLAKLVLPSVASRSPLDQLRALGQGWLMVSQIREVMSDSEFRVALFEDKVQILDQGLGQPRMGEEIMGSRQFKLVVL